MTTTTTVPFSPIPTEPQDMSFEPGEWTYSGSPVLWEQNYRDAAHRLMFALDDREVDRARVLARTGRALEDAYLIRVGAEARARRAHQ